MRFSFRSLQRSLRFQKETGRGPEDRESGNEETPVSVFEVREKGFRPVSLIGILHFIMRSQGRFKDTFLTDTSLVH